MKQIFKDPPLVCYKKDKNLQDTLVHYKHKKLFYNSSPGSYQCGKSCRVCPFINVTTTFLDSNNKISYNINHHIDCKTENVIYTIYCKKCQKTIYVGQTSTTLYQRMLLNLSRINTKRTN